jgi:hypothetical protein
VSTEAAPALRAFDRDEGRDLPGEYFDPAWEAAEALRQQLAALTAANEELRADVESFRADADAMGVINDEVQRENEVLRTANDALVQANANLERRVELLDEVVEKIEVSHAYLEDRNAELTMANMDLAAAVQGQLDQPSQAIPHTEADDAHAAEAVDDVPDNGVDVDEDERVFVALDDDEAPQASRARRSLTLRPATGARDLLARVENAMRGSASQAVNDMGDLSMSHSRGGHGLHR